MNLLQDSFCRDLVEASANGDFAAAKNALRFGASATSTTPGLYGSSIHQAVWSASPAIVELLLDAGCPVDLLTSAGTSALAMAIHEIADTTDRDVLRALHDIVDILLARGASGTAGDNREQAPLVLARIYGMTTLERRLTRGNS